MKIIDAHSHLGMGYKYSKPATFTEYFSEASRLGVVGCVLMSTPSPIHIIQKSSELADKIIDFFSLAHQNEISEMVRNSEITQFSYTPLLRESNDKLIYFQLIKIGNHEIKEELHINKMNLPSGAENISEDDIYYIANNEILDLSKRNSQIIPVALVFAKTLSKRALSLLDNQGFAGYKIHGVASYSGPEDIPTFFIDYLRDTRKPLVVHTDYNSNLSGLKKWNFERNSSLNWTDFAIRNNIRLYLTHGARLCQETFKKIENNPNFLVGIGPDIALSKDPARLQSRVNSEKDYLDVLIKQITRIKLAFDIDYPWNFEPAKKSNLNWRSIDTILNRHSYIGDEKLEQLFYNNAREFFLKRGEL